MYSDCRTRVDDRIFRNYDDPVYDIMVSIFSVRTRSWIYTNPAVCPYADILVYDGSLYYGTPAYADVRNTIFDIPEFVFFILVMIRTHADYTFQACSGFDKGTDANY